MCCSLRNLKSGLFCRAWLPTGRTYTTLGTDGFGRGDTRAALRAFFNVDAASIVKAALQALKNK